MATERDHIAQAQHNTRLSKFLAEEMIYRDWVVITAFYAAVHYTEAMAVRRFGWHGDKQGGSSPHVWRLRLLQDHSSFLCWRSYSKLYETSREVRYLTLWAAQSGIASGYVTPDTARDLFDFDLDTIRQELSY